MTAPIWQQLSTGDKFTSEKEYSESTERNCLWQIKVILLLATIGISFIKTDNPVESCVNSVCDTCFQAFDISHEYVITKRKHNIDPNKFICPIICILFPNGVEIDSHVDLVSSIYSGKI